MAKIAEERQLKQAELNAMDTLHFGGKGGEDELDEIRSQRAARCAVPAALNALLIWRGVSCLAASRCLSGGVTSFVLRVQVG